MGDRRFFTEFQLDLVYNPLVSLWFGRIELRHKLPSLIRYVLRRLIQTPVDPSENAMLSTGIEIASNASYSKGRCMMAALDAKRLKFEIETEKEVDGRWIAEIPGIPGAMAYGKTKQQAIAKASALALRVIADRMEEQEQAKESIKFACA